MFLRLKLVLVSCLLALVASVGYGSVFAADAVEVDVTDTGNGIEIMLTVAGDVSGRKIEACGYYYEPIWKDLEDGRRTTTYAPGGDCNSMTLTGEKIIYDNSTLWRVVDGWILLEDASVATPTVAEIEVSDASNGTQLIFKLKGDRTGRQVESCGVMYDVIWTDRDDGRFEVTFNVAGNCDSATVTGSKTYVDNAQFWNVVDGWIRKVPQSTLTPTTTPTASVTPTQTVTPVPTGTSLPPTYVEVNISDASDGTIINFDVAGAVNNRKIESCGIFYDPTWTELDYGRWFYAFSVVGNCDSATLTGDKTYVDNAHHWDIIDGWIRWVPQSSPTASVTPSVTPSSTPEPTPEPTTTPVPPSVLQVEVSDASNGTQIILTATGDVTGRKIESCGIVYDASWTILQDGRHQTTHNVVGNCDSATLTGDKVYIDNAQYWDIIDGWIRWVPQSTVTPGPTGEPTGEPTPDPVPTAPAVHVYDASDGKVVIFEVEDTTGRQVESCGIKYDPTWTKLQNGLSRTEFSVIGDCDSVTLTGDKVYVDHATYWNVVDGWIRRGKLSLWLPSVLNN